MKLFAQIRKVDEAKRLVYGRLAEEVVDKADEIMDYASSKPYFQKWSEEIAKDTDGKSVGNLRAMHGKIAAGKFTEIVFNDDEKAIDVCAKVVDDNEWNKVLEGVYTGFSVGGSYVGAKKVVKMEGRDVARYTASPNEGSLVDRPCIPTAKFFEVQKADGTLAKVDFKAPAADEEATINGTPEQVDELVKLMAAKGLNLGDIIAKVNAPEAQPAAAATPAATTPPATEVQKLDAGALRKSMWACADLAYCIQSLMSLKTSAAYEAFYEGDDSGIAKRLGAVIALAGEVLVEMVQMEVAESNGADTTITVELSDKVKGLAKFADGADPLLELLKVGARNSGKDKERISKIHDLSVELGHECATEKSAPAGELAKVDAAAITEALAKFDAEKLQPMQKALDEANATIKKLSAQPAPARITLRTVSKSDDVGSGNEPPATTPVRDPDGSENATATLIKSIHQSGGRPLGPDQLRK